MSGFMGGFFRHVGSAQITNIWAFICLALYVNTCFAVFLSMVNRMLFAFNVGAKEHLYKMYIFTVYILAHIFSYAALALCLFSSMKDNENSFEGGANITADTFQQWSQLGILPMSVNFVLTLITILNYIRERHLRSHGFTEDEKKTINKNKLMQTLNLSRVHLVHYGGPINTLSIDGSLYVGYVDPDIQTYQAIVSTLVLVSTSILAFCISIITFFKYKILSKNTDLNLMKVKKIRYEYRLLWQSMLVLLIQILLCSVQVPLYVAARIHNNDLLAVSKVIFSYVDDAFSLVNSITLIVMSKRTRLNYVSYWQGIWGQKHVASVAAS
uniref:Serpentine Receptor, class T n=1 Tax=Panagrellus redivivus TaxID=6233 RepID=A0A7E5A0F4_PANRE